MVTREEFPLEKATREVLMDEVGAVLGYGVQGPAQALNMRDNGIQVIVGLKIGQPVLRQALADGWVPGKTLFSLEEATERASVVQFLGVRRGQRLTWLATSPNCKKGAGALLFTRFWHRIPRPDRGHSPETVDVRLWWPPRFRHECARQLL